MVVVNTVIGLGLSYVPAHFQWINIFTFKQSRDIDLKKQLCLIERNNTYTYKNWCE